MELFIDLFERFVKTYAVQHNSCVLSKVDPAANKRFFISDNKREIVLHFYTNQ